jgi:4-alpha-glucanotransferase
MTAHRVAGCVIPLFSLRTERDWGIGQITDLPACATWVRASGHKLLQLLPPYELAAGETSPYGARTAFGLDPLYIGIEAIEDLEGVPVVELIGNEGETELARLRTLDAVDYPSVRALKTRALATAFTRFYEREWVGTGQSSPRSIQFRAFVEREHEWLGDLSLYVALRESHNDWSWQDWPPGQSQRDPVALAEASESMGRRILEYQYLQWIAHTQWDRARGEMRGIGVELMGDLPFVVGRESADVWSRPEEFRRDASLGAPPDAFSPEGQDWGLPPYDVSSMLAHDLSWLRARTRHAARLYDRFRLDHVVGYFRQWVKPASGSGSTPHVTSKGAFTPTGEKDQQQLGEHLLKAFITEAAPARIVAEDLGVIPPFVRRTLNELKLPGYRVIPWEKQDGVGFRDPAKFPEVSVATYSTHDTAPITGWWDELDPGDRRGIAAMAHVDEATVDRHALWKALLRLLFNSGAELTLTLVSELLGESRRINLPGTVGGANWTYRLPASLEALERDPAVVARMREVRVLIEQSGR